MEVGGEGSIPSETQPVLLVWVQAAGGSQKSLEMSVSRNNPKTGEEVAAEGLKESGGHTTGSWKKGDSHSVTAETRAAWVPRSLWDRTYT